MELKVEVKGLRELEKALGELEPKIIKRGFREAFIAAAEPQIAAAKANAPRAAKAYPHREVGELADSIKLTSIRFNKHGGKARIGPKRKKGDTAQSPGVWGLFIEYGSVNNKPTPYLRPAFDATKYQSVDAFADKLRLVIPTLSQ